MKATKPAEGGEGGEGGDDGDDGDDEVPGVYACVYVCAVHLWGVRSMFFRSDLSGFRDYTVDDLLPVSDVSVKSYEHFMVVRKIRSPFSLLTHIHPYKVSSFAEYLSPILVCFKYLFLLKTFQLSLHDMQYFIQTAHPNAVLVPFFQILWRILRKWQRNPNADLFWS